MAMASIEVKIRDAMIKRLNDFIFNSDAKELLDEIMNIEAKLIRLEKTKGKIPFRNSFSSFPPRDLIEKRDMNNQDMQFISNLKADLEEIEEIIEIQKSKKDTLENELHKLEDQERKRYNSVSLIEKQNFEVLKLIMISSKNIS